MNAAPAQPPTPLTVGKLRALLATLPDGTEVILAKDAEGNGYSPAYDLTAGHFETARFNSGAPAGYGEFRPAGIDGLTAICLWPMS